MKIKCCHNNSFEDWIDLANHIIETHKMGSVANDYAKLLFKIHEKIEYHRDLRRDTQMRDIDSDPVIAVLLSLLENEK